MPELALFGGVVALGGLLLLVYLFVNADPARLARILKWSALGVAGALFLFLLLSERFAFIWLPLTLAFPYLRPYLRSFLARLHTPGASSASEVVTPYLRMSLDHEIADGEDEPIVVDDDARARALAAQIADRAPVRIDECLDMHDARQHFQSANPGHLRCGGPR